MGVMIRAVPAAFPKQPAKMLGKLKLKCPFTARIETAKAMNDSLTLNPSKQVIEIGISNLPELSANMIAGGLYALKAETPSARYPLLAGSLRSALKSGLTCTIIVPSKPELFIQRIESFGNFDSRQLLASNQLLVFVMQDEFSKKMFRFGAERFAQELAQYEIPKNSFLIFDQADELLSLHDISLALDQVESLRKWFSEWKLTGLLVFSRATEEHSETINALMDSLTGIARLGGGKDGLEITFEYWQSPDGTLAAQNYQLKMLETGLYEATIRVAPGIQIVGAASAPSMEFKEKVEEGTPHFFYMNPDLSPLAQQVPGVWQHVDTLIGMLHNSRNNPAGMSILSFHRDTQLRELAETVHTLRLNLGRRARIIVQEIDASLRYQNEALLLRLGINLVIHKDVPISRLPLLLESLNGQVFNRDVGINFETALANVLPTRLRGYLSALRFRREVQFLMDRAEMLNIPSVLIVGKPIPGMSTLDVLQNVSLTRAGDLNSSDGESCLIFLNACPESVMRATLDKILGAPAEALFDSIEFFVQNAEITSHLINLLGATERGEFPDYSSLLNRLPDQVHTTVDDTEDRSHLNSSDSKQFPESKRSRAMEAEATAQKSQARASQFKSSLFNPEDNQGFNYNDRSDAPAAVKKTVSWAKRSVPASDSKNS